MDLIFWLAIFMVFIFVLRGLYNIYKVVNWKLREIKSFNEGHILKKPDTYFYIIIPALREQNVIYDTLKWISNLNYPKKLFEVIVALDKKEEKNLTKEKVKEYIRENKSGVKVSFVEYHGKGHKRSFQLNTALKEIFNLFKNKKDVFVGVYDADSRPEKDTLLYVDFKKSKENIAFQQTINYLLNSKKISKFKNNFLLLGNAYYQTMWNYIAEINQFLKNNSRFEKGKNSLFPPYCMGHGEFFNLDLLKKIKGFPNNGPADGIQIGFVLALKKVKIIPIPLDDSCESPEKLSVLFKQHTFWFCGNLNFFKIINNEKFGLSKIMQIVNHTFLSGKWLIRPFFYTFLFLYAIIIIDFVALIILLILPFVYYLIGYYFIKIQLFNSNKNLKLNFFGLEIIFAMYFKSFGAVNGLFKKVKSGLFGSKLKFSKVER